MKIPIMSYAINLTFWLLVWLVPGEKFYGLGTGFQFQTIPVPLYVLNPMGLLCIPKEEEPIRFEGSRTEQKGWHLDSAEAHFNGSAEIRKLS